uniref:Pyruvate:ferredoxin oxidoreductase PFO-5 n=1 Tax=Mastigamoeba balamuthi TaxID=108607 RepID=A0A0B4R3B8_MASBA|nr:pyruvate:ferredoxin oxidoreductase PFO-5 [Mastigamoeba balamuthi]
MSAPKLEAIDGNEASAYVAYGLSEFVIIFPITPSSTMAEKCDAWSAAGKKNAFGTVPIVYQMESEAGVSGALHGCGATGGLGVSFTSSQGLMLMIPNLLKLAGELIPAVIHVAARQVGTGATSIYCDHSDVMTVRSTGMAMVCSASAQECMDFAAASHLASIESSLPTLHFFDGFTTSHSLQSALRLPYDLLGSLVNREKLAAFRKTGLEPSRPHQRGCVVGRQEWMQIAEATNLVYRDYADAFEKALGQLEAHTGRHYNLYEWVGAPDATRAIVMMGSSGLTAEEVVDWMVAAGEKVGILRVRMFRPWCEDRFLAALPKTVKRVAVLDRCREAGAAGEPLFLDAVSTFVGAGMSDVVVVGGRYGLGDKAFTQSHVAAVFANLAQEKPKRRFTLGVVDDVTHMSLAPVQPPTAPAGVVVPRQASIWGMGSDGSVGACHMALRLLTVGANLQVQGQFFYTAHKSGGVTTSHMRFGKAPIKGQCAVTRADYIGVHQSGYIGRYDMLCNAIDGAIVVVNAGWKGSDDVPAAWRHELAQKHIRLYALDASNTFKRAGSLALTAAFLKLAPGDAISPEKAIGLLKEEAINTFKKKGDAVVAMNLKAIDEALSSLLRIDVPAEWINTPVVPLGEGLFETPRTPFERVVKAPLQRLNGDDIPVSAFRDLVTGGRTPATTTRSDKRAIADKVPTWSPAKCTQCNFCSAACPHAVIRPFLLTKEEAAKAGLSDQEVKPATGAGAAAGYLFRVQVSVNDCTGCGVCAAVCPTKCLDLKPLPEVAPVEGPRWKHLFEQTPSRADVYPRDNVRGLQFVQPLLEFNGACAGCGEAAYIKMLTQIMGERAIFVCASGCNVAYAFAFGSNPYCQTPEGRGPAVAHSLFEDTAEFGLGSAYTVLFRRNLLVTRVTELLASNCELGELRARLVRWLEVREDPVASNEERKLIQPLLEKAPKTPLLDEIRELSESLTKASVWCIGGDGWASDIDYGGLDHVLSLGLPVKVLIMDTEVYSNTGGQQSKATPTSAVHKFAAGGKKAPKKDLAMTFLASHERVAYVAAISSSANIAQSMKAFTEAEAFPGPAVVVAYSPCIEHGIEAPKEQ